jgi:predicted protein tyrosine phosphatase
VYMQKRIISLDIPDVYRHGQKELIDTLTAKMEKNQRFIGCASRGCEYLLGSA